jgi:predicted transcriptional regulator
MMKRAALIAGLLFVVCLCPVLTIPASANLGGYTVEPASESDIAAVEPLETVLVPFWDLPPRIMLVAIVLSLSPFLLFPLELLFLLKMFAFLGFRRLRKKSVLDHPTRMFVFCIIRENPGIGFMEISWKTGTKAGTLRYHLSILKLMNKVTALETSGNARYFENAGCYSKVEQKLIKHLKSPPNQVIFRLVMENPDLSRGHLESALKMSGPGVNWYLNRLSCDGLLTISKYGRNARYALSPDVVPLLCKYLPDYRQSMGRADGVIPESAT